MNDKIKEMLEEIEELKESCPSIELTPEECKEVEVTIKHTKSLIKEQSNDTNPYTEQRESAESEVKKYDESVMYNLLKQEAHYKILIKLLTDNKSFVRKNLLEQYIPFINTKVRDYLDRVELPHRVMFNNDLTVDIEYMRNSVSYGNLSNGEKNRLNFAVSMAFRDLLSMSGGKFNLFMIDELLDNGLDQSGFKSVFKILMGLEDTSTYIISHRDDLVTSVDRTMKVIKQNGFSEIEMI